MKIYKLDTASDFEKLNLCLAIGNFDGIHKGHQEIINKIKEIASNNNLLSSIMSFNPHPRIYFNQINEPFNIYTQGDKINFLERLGLDIFIALNKRQLTSEETTIANEYLREDIKIQMSKDLHHHRIKYKITY